MDNQTGLSILSSVLNSMSYRICTTSDQENSKGITIVSLQKMLLKGCYKRNNCEITDEPQERSAKINISVKTMAGNIITRRVIVPSEKIVELKKSLFDTEGIPIEEQCFIFDGELLEESKSYEDYGIMEDDCIIHLLVKMSGGTEFYFPPSRLDEEFNKDFTKISDDGENYYRGGFPYSRPYGWQRYALKVKGVFEDDVWLEGRSPRVNQHSSAEAEWPVSYHGTSYNNGLSIADEGYKLKKGKRFEFGYGIYSAPDIEVASKYAVPVEVNGKIYKFVLQNRVNPANLKIIGKSNTGAGEYWMSPHDEDIRVYGFCIQEC